MCHELASFNLARRKLMENIQSSFMYIYGRKCD
uniref:Uncharacterized protein n=1 Tax=Anguilla anguilla TaxID=7936 RepID=A0A0E9QWK9_ANGAN